MRNVVALRASRYELADDNVDAQLARPLMGVSQVVVNVDQCGVGYEFSVYGSFRRGLAREESLRKIEALRQAVERECGFKLNDYSFSARRSTGMSPLVGGSVRNRRSLINDNRLALRRQRRKGEPRQCPLLDSED